MLRLQHIQHSSVQTDGGSRVHFCQHNCPLLPCICCGQGVVVCAENIESFLV